MKKILHISKFYYPYVGGTEQVARDCVYGLREGYDQKVISFNDNRKEETITVDGVEVIKCGIFATVASQPLSFTYKKKLFNVIKNYSPDIVILHYPNPFVSSFLLPMICKTSTKLVIYWHLDIVKQKRLKRLFYKQNIKLLERADMVIATSPNYIEGSPWLKKYKAKCKVVPNCINVDRMTITDEVRQRANEIREQNKGKTICVAVGRHTEYKGFEYLIKASKLLDDNFHIYITGTGELSSKLHRQASGDEKVFFAGRVSDDELKALLLASDIFCFPSITKNEAFGLALAEGMYYGKPAVTFSIEGSGVNYVSINGETGIEVENRNVEKYAQALGYLSKNQKIMEKYGLAAQKRITENFLSEQYYENIKNAIVNV